MMTEMTSAAWVLIICLLALHAVITTGLPCVRHEGNDKEPADQKAVKGKD